MRCCQIYAPCLLGSAAAALGMPSEQTARATKEPCAKVRDYQAAGLESIPSRIAYECLKSVPLDKDGDVQLLKELKTFFGFQSNLAWLKEPPPHYNNPKVDILGSLDEMGTKLQSGHYTRELDFAIDLWNLTMLSRDNHMGYQPDILGVFSFSRDVELISVSSDGHALPEVYVTSDVLPEDGNASLSDISHITQINGRDANEYLSELGHSKDNSQFHDADTRFNTLFTNQVRVAAGSSSPSFTYENHHVGDRTELLFANGSTRSFDNVAAIVKDFTGVKDGKTFFKKFCSGPEKLPTPTDVAPEKRAATSEAVQTGYPKAFAKTQEAWAYAIDTASKKDTIVISLPTFMFDSDPTLVAFQTFLDDVIAYSKAHQIKKLVIDLRTNGGGMLFGAYSLFMALFPNITPYGATALRASDSLNAIGLAAAGLFSNTNVNDTIYSGETEVEIATRHYLSWTFYKANLNVNEEGFDSWQDYYGPQHVHGDDFTHLSRYNFSDIAATGADLTRYLTDDDSEPPFAAENIVLVQDGDCSSSCAIFSELMKTQAHVKTIAVGGRPHYGPMQTIGGTKGAQVIDFAVIAGMATAAFQSSDTETQQQLSNSDFAHLITEGQAVKRVTYGTDGKPLAMINWRDNIRKGDTSHTPLEFVYEAADCRLFYTLPMLRDVRQLWKSVAAAQWGDHTANGTSPLCVRGSTGHPSAVGKEGVPWGVLASNGTSSPGTPTTTPTPSPQSSQNAAALLQVSIVGPVLAGFLAASFL